MAEQKIGARFFKMDDVLATEAIKLNVRLMRFLGPAMDKIPTIFAALSSKATEEQRRASDAASIQAMGDIFSRADPEDVTLFVASVCEMAKVSYDGKNFDDVIFDQEFSGSNLKDVVPVTLFVLREAVGDFISGALASGNREQKAVASRKQRSDG